MNQLSTETLTLLPAPIKLKQICKGISALEAIFCQEWEYRYYSYQKKWSDKAECCQMRDDSGDEMLILFSEYGVCINGFAHESEMNGWKNKTIEKNKFSLGIVPKEKTELTQKIWAGVISELPNVFNEFILEQPVKSIGTTFCIWQTKDDTEWKIGKIKFPKNEYKDGSKEILQLLDGKASTYKEWAEEYYEENLEGGELKLNVIETICKGAIITHELVNEINPELEDLEQLKSDLNEIGYEHNL